VRVHEPGATAPPLVRCERVTQNPMSQRTDVDPSLSPVPISGRILNEVYSHALSEWPAECCVMIVGDEHERY